MRQGDFWVVANELVRQFEVVRRHTDGRRFRTFWDFEQISWNDKTAYLKKLTKLENADSWRMLRQWEQF